MQRTLFRPETRQPILVTGSTGYVGGRLTRALEERGLPLRCMARRREALAGRTGPRTEVVRGDVCDPTSLDPALQGIETAFYLVHSMGSGGDFEAMDRLGARNFASAARRSGLRRIVYLGGLGDPEEALSRHLRSRHEVGEILRSSGVPVLELRASIVLGAGSLSFEMIRALVERLPVMVTPRWVDVPAQPIAIEDLVRYLVESIDVPLPASRTVEIGGPEVVSYGGLMREYARQRGLRRYLLRVPLLTPRLSGLWLGLVTPLQARIGRKLVESIRHPTVVRETSADELFTVRPAPVGASIARAIAEGRREGGVRRRLTDSRTLRVRVPPDRAFAPIRRIGGRNGWYALEWLWKLRGRIDRILGGVGMHRGRAHPERLAPGDVLDCWRVEELVPDRRLRLRAEMKLPGTAWLEFEVERTGDGSLIRQTATFEPSGLAGIVYWYSVLPLHVLVFSRMIREIARRSTSPRGIFLEGA